MASIFVTGSSDGIGLETARVLVAAGHQVLLHARSERRGAEAIAQVLGASGVAVGDLASLSSTAALADAVRHAGPFDAVVHNAGVGGGQAERQLTDDGIELIFQVNVLAPYVLTALLPLPARLVYLSSGLQASGTLDLDDLEHEHAPWRGMQAYSDSKLADVVLALAIARRGAPVLSNAVDPGWIKTKMGGAAAPGALAEGADTPAWLAASDDPAALVSGAFFHRRQRVEPNPVAGDPAVQDALLEACAKRSGIDLSF